MARCNRLLAVAVITISAFSAAATVSAADANGPGKSPVSARRTVSYTIVASGLAGPRGLVFHPSGELYVAEQSSGTIAKVTLDGRVTRVATGLSQPHDLAFDAKGNLYVADSGANRIAKVSPAGVVTTYIDDVSFPVDLDFNPGGELLVCELYRGRVVAFKGRERTRVVASGLSWPHGLAFGNSGEIFINENTGNRIVKVGPDGKVQRFAQIERPVGVVLHSGNLYVAQPQVGKVSKITADRMQVILLEGLKGPRDPAFDSAGNLYVAETESGRILKLSGDY